MWRSAVGFHMLEGCAIGYLCGHSLCLYEHYLCESLQSRCLVASATPFTQCSLMLRRATTWSAHPLLMGNPVCSFINCCLKRRECTLHVFFVKRIFLWVPEVLEWPRFSGASVPANALDNDPALGSYFCLDGNCMQRSNVAWYIISHLISWTLAIVNWNLHSPTFVYYLFSAIYYHYLYLCLELGNLNLPPPP